MKVKHKKYYTDELLFVWASGNFVSAENTDLTFADFLGSLDVLFDDDTQFVRINRYYGYDLHTIEIHCFGNKIRVKIYNITYDKLLKLTQK